MQDTKGDRHRSDARGDGAIYVITFENVEL